QQTRGEGPGDPKSNLRCCQLSTVCPCILLASETSCRDQGHAPNEPRLSGAHGGRPESDRTQRRGCRMLADLIITGGTLVTSEGERRLALAVQDGRILAVDRDEAMPPARQVVDAA